MGKNDLTLTLNNMNCSVNVALAITPSLFLRSFPDIPIPDFTRAVILSQEESSPQGPEAPEPPHQ